MRPRARSCRLVPDAVGRVPSAAILQAPRPRAAHLVSEQDPIPPFASSDTFADFGASSVNAARMSRQPVSLLLVEIDHFELIDRTHGAQFAERVLETVARVAEEVLRPRDRMSWRRGSQFAVLVPGGAPAGVELAGRMAAAVRACRFDVGEHRDMTVSVSVGVAAAPVHAESYPALLAAAERALRRAVRLGEGGIVSALEPAQEPPHPPLDVDRFVGRTDQMRTLVRIIEDAVAGRAQVAVVHGEVGVGCSTVVAQLAPEIAVRGGAFVRGRARRLQVRPPYGVWAELLEDLGQLPGGAPVGEWRELPNLVPALASPTTACDGSGGSQFRLLEELAAYVGAAAASRPLVLVLDDMQWADEASWDALDHLAAKLGRASVAFLVVMRDDPRDPATVERRQKLRQAGAHDVALSRLTRDEVKRWVEAAFDHQEVGREFLSFIYRNAEGNPLFIGQLLRGLVEEGAVRHTGERWEWGPVSQLQVPASLDALVIRRITRLGARAQLVLATAAVLLRDFEVGLIAAALAGESTDVEITIRDAVDSGLLRPAANGQATAVRYDFAHDQLAHIFAGQLAPQHVRRAHERVARALDAMRDETAAPARAIEIAIHYEQAGVAAGAHAAALRAADHAERLYARPTASELLRLAARTAGTPAELAADRTRLATLAELAGQYDEAEELCDLAIEWYTGQGDVSRSLALRAVRERLRSQLGQPARRTLDTLLALDREAAEQGLAAERVAILTQVSQTYGRLGDRASAERIAADCVAMAEQIDDRALLADSLNRYAITMELEDPERAKSIFGRALELYEARADYRGQARIHNNIGIVAQLQGRQEEATRELSTAISLARTAGMPDFWGAAALNLGVMTMKAGAHERARELLSEALSLFAAVKNSELQLYALYNLAHLERERGEHQTAAELYEVAVSLAQRIGQVDVEAGALGGGGLSLLELGRTAEAASMLRTAEARLQDRADWFLGRELIEVLGIRVALLEGRADDAAARFERASASADGSDLYSAAWLTAECAPLLDAHDHGLVRERVAYYAGRVGELGFPDMTRRYAGLAAAS